jgi:hypothetical protein
LHGLSKDLVHTVGIRRMEHILLVGRGDHANLAEVVDEVARAAEVSLAEADDMLDVRDLLEVRWEGRVLLQSLFYAAEHGDVELLD